MNDTPAISIITTVKNAGEFLIETLATVYNQTYKNYEHIIVDDGSVDATVAVIDQFKHTFSDHKIKLIATDGIGRGKALNLGVLNAAGEWIAILDGDDLWHPQKLQLQVNNSVTGVDVLCTDADVFTTTSQIQYGPVGANKLTKIKRKALLRSNQLSHSSVLIRKKLCRYDNNRVSQLDYELWLRLISEGFNLFKLDQVLSFHRIHPNQTYEGKMGKGYRWRSFKLKIYYAYKFKDISAIGYNVFKLIFDILFPRKLRLLIRKQYR
jgi:teichuronic acid biosynthesis glycosyltransferase TuaG